MRFSIIPTGHVCYIVHARYGTWYFDTLCAALTFARASGRPH